MRKSSRVLGPSVLITAALALAMDVATATAVPIPGPQFVLPSNESAFLKEEMKHATSLQERKLIHDELVLVYLDGLREPK